MRTGFQGSHKLFKLKRLQVRIRIAATTHNDFLPPNSLLLRIFKNSSQPTHSGWARAVQQTHFLLDLCMCDSKSNKQKRIPLLNKRSLFLAARVHQKRGQPPSGHYGAEVQVQVQVQVQVHWVAQQRYIVP